MRSLMPRSAKVRYTRLKPILNGKLTWSENTSGAAPVPPPQGYFLARARYFFLWGSRDPIYLQKPTI